MKILFFGDVFGRPGREALVRTLPSLAKQYNSDAIIVNVENIAHGNGITRSILEELNELKIDVYTSGDHIWDDPEAREMVEEDKWHLIRPENFPPGTPGAGHIVVEIGSKKLLVINVLGQAFIRADLGSSFHAVDRVLEKYKLGKDVDAILIDFHAETTSEKRAMGFHVDGRVSAVVGTHTHVPTNDAQVLPKGTGYLTDSGFVGAYHSVIGLSPDMVLRRFLTQMPASKELADTGKAEIGGVFFEIGDDGLAKDVQSIRKIVDIGQG